MMQLEVSNIPYTNFTSMNVTQDIENFAGQFNFAAIDVEGRFNSKDYPIKLGSMCRVTIDGTPVLTGFVEVVDVAVSDGQHSVHISGRDITCDLVDSTLPADFSLNASSISLVNIIKKVQAVVGLNLPIINQVTDLTDFTATEIISAEAGQGCFDFIEQHARKKRVIVTTDGSGAIVITRSQGTPLGMSFVNKKNDSVGKNNITSSGASYDYSQRFSRYIVGSQSNMQGLDDGGAGDTDNETLVDAQSEFTDTQMPRTTRALYIVAENSGTVEDARKRAEWEANIRMARSKKYSCTVDKHTVSAKKPFWFNHTALVVDDDCGINETMLIKAVTFKEDLSGAESELSFVVRNSYSLELEAPQSVKDTNKSGNVFEGEALSDAEINKAVEEYLKKSAADQLQTKGRTG